MKPVFVLCLCMMITVSLVAQDPVTIVSKEAADSVFANKENLRAVIRYRDGAIELRWFPLSAGPWRKGNLNGYLIERMELNEAADNDFKQIAIVKPFTSEEWRTKTDGNDKLVKATIEAMQPVTPKQGQSFAEIENEENMLFFSYMLGTTLSASAAKGAGVMYVDKAIENGKSYAYRISINDPKKIEVNDRTLAFITDTKNPTLAPAVEDVSVEEGEGTVKLTWNNTSNQENFVGYFIERSSDGGRTFTTLNKQPYISVAKGVDELSYTDSVRNYVPYRYRIVGITSFTDKGTPSSTLIAMGKDRTPASPPMNVRAKGDRSKILVTWELPVASKDLKGFIVGRARKLEGPFVAISDEQRLLGNGVKLFMDNNPSPMEPYYAVYSVDTANNLSTTFSVMASVYDTVGPARPTGVRGTIDSTGLVKLTWAAGTDVDLVGYQVYTANSKDNVFRQVTGNAIGETSFIDTVSMRSLTEEVFYKITAVDYNNNPSEYSELLVLKRPDVIAPAAPVIANYSVDKNRITLHITPSSSDDIVRYQLTRMDDAGTRSVLADARQLPASYVDTAISDGMNYSYAVIAIDDAGHQTASKPLRISVLEQEVREGVEALTARIDDRGKKVLLNWNAPGSTGYTVVLFRSVNDTELEWYKKVPASTNQFTESLDAGKYQYAIKLLYSNGAESSLSRPVSVEIK